MDGGDDAHRGGDVDGPGCDGPTGGAQGGSRVDSRAGMRRGDCRAARGDSTRVDHTAAALAAGALLLVMVRGYRELRHEIGTRQGTERGRHSRPTPPFLRA